MIRYALVSLARNDTTADTVTRYLPDNYRVIWTGEVAIGAAQQVRPAAVIAGEDRAGWTLDAYVIPRLGSGLIFAEEVDLSHPVMKQVPMGGSSSGSSSSPAPDYGRSRRLLGRHATWAEVSAHAREELESSPPAQPGDGLRFERLVDLSARTSAELRRLDWELRELGPAGPETRKRGQELVAQIRLFEELERELRREVRAHPMHTYDGL